MIDACEVRDSVIGGGSSLTNCRLHGSIVGDHVKVDGVRGALTVGDHSEVRADA